MSTTGARTYLKTHRLSGKELRFDLSAEQAALLERAKEGRTGRTAKTLVKEGPLRMTLVALRKGSSMMKHHVDGQASVHVLRGKLTIGTERGNTELSAADVLVLADGVEHNATARTDCSFLITMSWRA